MRRSQRAGSWGPGLGLGCRGDRAELLALARDDERDEHVIALALHDLPLELDRLSNDPGHARRLLTAARGNHDDQRAQRHGSELVQVSSWVSSGPRTSNAIESHAVSTVNVNQPVRMPALRVP